ncbi:hemagglutinin repeat-containing protein [Cedecea sp. NFIX57]|uniref:hemagglutinin repeat-containing protein n=1 Tax=Cedecea sp. NFIX57 TaxID=1566286 RepID=UPI000A0C4977|nr:hemagglutinin repeat-containing protein [Cedecea sp. NFIX57]SMG11529.1 filamentous hemagglutinin [Cedecea sp. NFIX57]
MDKHPVGLAKRLLSYLIICLLAGQPVFPAVAATINPVTPGTQMDQAGNGVPVVNIATPNQAGISHNQFQNYNVGKEGLILNNATGQLTQTQLGGLVQNNPNLRAGQEATGIINEVVGGNRSQLQGYTEVAGKAANVMVANPYGITCNGCGFINTPNATLTTGKPQFDAAGNLLALDVSKGTITVEGQGLDASKSDALSIIARATEVNAGIHAKDLKVTVGANRVSSTGTVTPIAGEGAAPVVAVDTGALGGMYANRIHLVSSDKGVGVNLGNLNARQGDITLDANGKLVVNNSLASGNLTAQADNVVLSGEHKSGGATQVNSRTDITVANGNLASDRDISLNGSGKLALNNGLLAAGNDITLNAGAVSTDAASEANAGGTIRASAATRMDNAGKLTAGRDVAVSADQLINSGQIAANGNLNARAGSFNNSGNLQAQRNIQLDLGSFTHNGQMLAGAGLMATTGDAWIDGMLSSGTDQAWTNRNAFTVGRNGQLLSGGNLALQADSFSNAGTVNGKQDVTLSSNRFNGLQGSALASGGNLELLTQQLQSAGQITSQKDLIFKGERFETLAGGQLQSEGNMLLQANNSVTLNGTHAAKGALTVNTGSLTHSGSTKGNTVTLGAKQLDTSGNIQADGGMSLTADSIVQQAGGALLAQKNLEINAQNLTNRGSLDSDALTLAIAGNIDNQASGKITARKDLNSTSDSFNNDGQVAASTLDLTAQTALTNTGSLLAEKNLNATAAQLKNTGQLGAASLDLKTTSLDNGGLLQGGQSLTLTAAELTNRSGGKIISGSGLALSIPQLTNAGLISVQQGLAIESLMLTNSGNIESQAMTLNAGRQLDNQASGALLAQDTLSLTADNFNNAGSLQGKNIAIGSGQWNNSGLTSGSESLTASVSGELKNGPQGKIIVGQPDGEGAISGGQFDLNAGSVTNAGWLQSGGGMNVTVQALVNAGVISASQAVTLEGLTLDNRGRIEAQDLQLKLRDKVNNFAGAVLVAKRSLQLSSSELDNAGQLIADNAVLDAQNVSNTGLLQGDSSLNATSDTFNNAEGGTVLAEKALTLAARQMTNAGDMQADSATLKVSQMTNSGKLLGLSILNLTATDNLVNTGKILGKDKLALTSSSLENRGSLAAADLSVESQRSVNGGLLQGEKSLRLGASVLNNLAQGKIISGSGLSLSIPELNNAGLISVEQGLMVDGVNLTNSGNIEASDVKLGLTQELDNQAGGVLLADNTLSVTAAKGSNAGKLMANNTTLAVDDLTNNGLLQGNQAISSLGKTLTNGGAGQLLSDGNIDVTAARLDNAGRLQGRNITLTGGQNGGENTGQILGREALNILFGGAFDNGGRLISQNYLGLKTGPLRNTGIIAASALDIDAGQAQAGNSGLIQADGKLRLTATSLQNDKGATVAGGDDVTLTLPELNNAGTISAGKHLQLDGRNLDNLGAIDAQNLDLNLSGKLNNLAGASLLAGNQMAMTTGGWTNAGQIIGDNVTISTLQGQNDGLLQGDSCLKLNATQFGNGAAGKVLTGGWLDLRGNQWNNTGLLQGQTLTLQCGDLHNTGSLSGKDRLSINTDKSVTNDGQMLSQGELQLATGQLDNNSVLAATKVGVQADTLNNRGTLQSNSGLDLHTAAVTNSGTLLAKQALNIIGANLDNSGMVQGDALTLALQNGLTNQATGKLLATGTLDFSGESLSNSGAVAADNARLAVNIFNNSGLVQGNNGLSLSGAGASRPQMMLFRSFAAAPLPAVRVLNNLSGGKLLSGGQLDIAANDVNNTGTVQTRDNLTFTAGSLSNQGTLSAGNLALNIVGQLNNQNGGKLLAADTLHSQSETLANSGVIAADKLELSSNRIDNQGVLKGDKTLALNTPQFNNLADGQIVSGSSLSLTIPQMVNLGLISVKEALTLSGASLDNQGMLQGGSLALNFTDSILNRNAAKLLAERGLTLQTASLDNQGTLAGDAVQITTNTLNNAGLLQGNTAMTLASGTPSTLTITNQNDGRIQTGGALALNLSTLANQGTLLAQQGMTVNADTVDNQGTLQGQDLTVNAATVNNLSGGRMLTGGQLALNGQKISNAGVMQGQTLGVKATNWDNSGSALGLSGLTAQVDNQLTNGGRLLSQGVSQISAGTFNNTGALLSEGDLTLSGSALLNRGNIQGSNLTASNTAIDNAGSVIGLKSLTLQPQQDINNRLGGAMQTQGAMLVAGQNVINGGLWQAQYLKLNAQQLQNSGTLQSTGNLDLALTSGLTNTGAITANNTAIVMAPGITNQGQIQAKNLALSGSSLNNGGNISGVEGLGISLGGNLDVQSGARLLTNGLLTVGANIITNLGHVQGNAVTLNAAALNNQGRVEANSALTGTLSGSLDNGPNAVLLSQGSLDLGAQQLSNTGTVQGNGNTRIDLRERGNNQGQLLSGGTLTLNAPGFTNGGWVQGSGLWLNAGSLSNSGTVLAQQQGTIGGSYILNNGMLQGGNLTVNPGQLDNNGTVYATQNLGITASQVNSSAGARLLSQGNMGINAVNSSLQGQVAALGNLSLNSQGSYNQLTTLAAGNALAVSSQGDINVNGLMQGQGVQLSAAGTLNNNGQVRAGYGESHLNAGQLNLNGAGSVQAGGTLRLTSQNGINNAGFVGTAGDLIASAGGTLLNSALLYAGNNMSLFANSIRNYRGDILAGNSLWMQRDAAGNANAEVVNTSGNIETQNGDISIRTGHLLNERDGFNIRQWTENNNQAVGDISLNVALKDLNPNSYTIKKWTETVIQNCTCNTTDTTYYAKYVPTAEYMTRSIAGGVTHLDVTASAGAARIASGSNLFLTTGTLDNQASNILAAGNVVASGISLSNMSYQTGTSTDYYVYQYQYTDVGGTWRSKNPQAKVDLKPIKANFIYNLTGHTTQQVQGELYRAVIQAGGAVVANFSNNISNTAVSANTPGYTPGRSAPGLNLAGGPGVTGGAQATDLKTGTNNTVAAPQATINLPGSGIGSIENPTGNGGLAAVDNRPQNGADYGQAGGKIADINLSQQGGSGIDLAGNTTGLADSKANGGNLTPVNGDAVELTRQSSGEPSRQKNDEIAAAAAQVIAQSSGGKTPPPPGYDYRPIELTDISAITSKLTASGSPIKLSDYPLPAGNNGYFVVNKDPKSPYLIVTNPKLDGLGKLDNSLFNDIYKLAGMAGPNAPQEMRAAYTDANKFLGSDYFLARLNLRPDYDYRFLGDAAFDTRYVSNQILNQTGNRYVNGVGSDLEQMQYLIDHAAQARDKLGLKLGVSLSADQVAALDSSILWWENAVIDGQNVLVPKLYISPKDVAVNNGSVIAGNQTILNAGNITNDGSTLQGKTLLSASSQNAISNINGGAINSGGSLQLSALGDINNIGSTIAGQKVSLESVGGSIINQTLTSQWNASGKTSGWYGVDVSFTKTDVGPLASINATDSLSLSAGKDILNTGANLSAGGDMLLKALDNISLTGNQLVERDQHGRNINETVTHQGSSVNSGGNLNLQAGRDLTVTSSNLNAGGSAALWAGNDLTLDVAKNSRHSQTSSIDILDTSNTRTAISAGKDLSLAAGRDLNSMGAALAAQENVGLQAGRDVNLEAAESTHSDKYTAKKKVDINESVRQQGTEIASGGNTTIIAGRDVNTQAAQVTAHGDIGVGAGRDINLATATDSDYHYDEETKTKKGFLSKKTTHTINETSSTREAGTLLSGDNVTLKAGNDLLVKGSAVTADGDIALKAGNNVTVEAAEDQSSSYSMKSVKKSGVFGGGGLGITIGSQSAKTERNGAEVKQSDARSVIGTTGGNVVIDAGKQVTLSAVDMVAGRSADDTARKTGHIDITGSDIAIIPGKDTVQETVKQSQKSQGIGISLSNPIVDSVLNLRDIVKARGDGISQFKALAAEGAASVADFSLGTSLPISYGRSSSHSESQFNAEYLAGSHLQAAGNVQLNAKGNAGQGDILINGSRVGAGEAIIAEAKHDITVNASTDRERFSQQSDSKSWGVTSAMPTIGSAIRTVNGGASHGSNVLPFGMERSSANGDRETQAQTGSQLSGREIYLNSHEGRIDISGSSLAAINDLLLSADKGDISVTAGNHTVRDEQHGSQTKVGNLGGDGYSGTVGWSKGSQSSLLESQQQSTLRSQLASQNGNVALQAGQDIALSGADISAGKTLLLNGENVRIDVSKDDRHTQSESSSTQYGVKGSTSGVIVSAVQAAEKSARSVQDGKDPRLTAIYAAQAGLNMASQTIQNDMNAPLVKVNVSVTAGSSQQQQEATSQHQQGSTLHAGESVILKARQDIEGAGVDIRGKTVVLDAGRDITLTAAQNTQSQNSSSSGSQFNAGVGFTLGKSQDGITIEAGYSANNSHANGNSLSNKNSTVHADELLSVNSGRDTALTGAVLSGDKVIANIGRDLTIASVQDTAKYDSRSTSSGANVSVCVPPICVGNTVQGSASFSAEKLRNNYQSVLEQSGIHAGQSGFDITVGNHTQLDGAVIASDATADKNRLDTGTLGWSELRNKSDWSGNSVNVSVSGGATQDLNTGQWSPVSQGMPTTGYGQSKGKEQGTTSSAIADGSIVIRDPAGQKQDVTDLSRDTANANHSVKDGFDADKVRDRLEIQRETIALGTQAADVYKSAMMKEADEKNAALKEELRKQHPLATDTALDGVVKSDPRYIDADKEYGPGSDFWRATSAVTGVMAGVLGGNIQGGMAAGAAPYMAKLVKDVSQGNEAARIALHGIVSAGLASAQGGNPLAAAAGGMSSAVMGDGLAMAFYGKKAEELEGKERDFISNLATAIGAVAGGSVGGDTFSAASGANAARVEVENNSLNSTMCAESPWACRGNPLIEGGRGPGGGGIAAGAGAGVAIGETLNGDDKGQPNIGKDVANATDKEKADIGGTGSGTPGGWGPQDEENARNGQKETVDDLISSSSKGQETTGRSKLFERTGGNNAANKEFDSLAPTEIKEIPGGRVGKLPDGRTVIVRERSTDGRPTLEIQSGKNRIKFRYDE